MKKKSEIHQIDKIIEKTKLLKEQDYSRNYEKLWKKIYLRNYKENLIS